MPVAKLRPWFQVVTPREDLRKNRPLDTPNEKDTHRIPGSSPPLQLNFDVSVVSGPLSVAGFSGPELYLRVFLAAPLKAFQADHWLRGSMSATVIQSYQGRAPL